MKQLYILITFAVILASTALGQVGINSDGSQPDPSAMLDVKSSIKGLLPPRVALIAINIADPIVSPAIGLHVYNTATAGLSPNNVLPGNYYWSGTRWMPVSPPQGANPGDMLYWNGTQYVSVPAGLPGQFLQMSASYVPTWAGTIFAAITTMAASGITASSATSGGNITSDGGSTITSRGICFNTSPNPTTSNYKNTEGNGTGMFASSLIGLTAGTTYYVKAFAINSSGTSYGNEINFTTLSNATLPSIYTNTISDIMASTATGGGTVNATGGATVTARGICWSTSVNPTTLDSHTINGSGTGGYWSYLTGLTPNTFYYVRAYATNIAGTGYGNQVTFTTNCASYLTVSISIAASANPVCVGMSVTFTATPTNGGASPTYQWKVNNTNVSGATNATYAYTPANGDAVSCVLTSNAKCVSGNPATSNAITMNVSQLLPVSVLIAASANPVCVGAAVTYAATPANGGTTPTYQWKVNGTNVNGATNATYAYVPANGDAITCLLTSNASCITGSPALSNIVTMTVNPLLPVSISIAASANPVNPGTSVTFTATPVNGGGSPVYQWVVNGVNVGTNLPTYSYVPVSNDSVKCLLTSNQTCITGSPAISNEIVMITNVMNVPCQGTPTVTYGGKTYNTVKIGTQCWFRENLNIGTRIDGVLEQTNNGIIEKYCYGDLESNCDVYGGLYQWAEVVQYLNGATNTSSWSPVPSDNVIGICPSGWLLPSSDELLTLVNYLGGTDVAGGKLKEEGTSHWFSPNTGATNESGFTALPGGYRTFDGNLGYRAYLWSSTEVHATYAHSRYAEKDHIWFYVSESPKSNGYSVRCIKDTCSTYSSTGVSIAPSANIMSVPVQL